MTGAATSATTSGRGRLLAQLALLALVLTVLALPTRTAAAEPVLTLTAAPAYAGTQVAVALTLTTADGPGAAQQVAVERRTGGAWRPLATVTLDEDGTASVLVELARDPADNLLRATWAGTEAHPAATAELRLPLRKRPSTLRLKGPKAFVDETSATLVATWRAARQPVDGTVTLQKRLRKKPAKGKEGSKWRWKTVRTGATDREGQVEFTVSPRRTMAWRVVGKPQPWLAKVRSKKRKLRNLPPGTPVQLPARAPKPRVTLPAQRRAEGAGANPRITRIPTKVWRSMVGRSWHRGCPVGRSGLRLLRINYWDYDGYRRRGELVAAAGAIDAMAGALAEMYRRQLPIRSMYRVDRFGWSGKLRGADDYRSMAAGNTSAFNCRHVVGRPGVRSPHASGRSLDVNPWENPYTVGSNVHPNRWWLGRSHPRVAWRSRDHAVVALMARHGLRWTYGRADLHHFDVPTHRGRIVVARPCLDDTCAPDAVD